MDLLLSANAAIFSVIATGIVDWRILPLTGLRRIIGRLDRAPCGNPYIRRARTCHCVGCPGDKLIAGY